MFHVSKTYTWVPALKEYIADPGDTYRKPGFNTRAQARKTNLTHKALKKAMKKYRYKLRQQLQEQQA